MHVGRHPLWSLLSLLCAAPLLPAQEVDVLRGRVTGLDSVPIALARVTAMSLSTRVSRTVRTDTKGRYLLTFPNGDGTYVVSVTAIGFAPKQFQLKRLADEDVLIGDARLGPATTVLDLVTVVGGRKKVARDKGSEPDIGGSEQELLADAVAYSAQDDFATLAASIPGIRLVPGTNGDPSGFSALGLGADQNSTSLNGGLGILANPPLDARISSSLALSPYDVSRGGFSGAQLSVRTTPGGFYRTHTGTVQMNLPSLQWTDRAARAWGQQFAALTLSEGLSGSIIPNQAFYSVAYQISRRQSDQRSLMNADWSHVDATGLAADSARHLLQTLDALGVPASAARVPSQARADRASVIGSFDLAPQASLAGTAFNLTVTAAWNRSDPIGIVATSMPSYGGERTNGNGAVQLRHSTYLPIGLLSESTLGTNVVRADGRPFAVLPSGHVLVASMFPDSTRSVASVYFGGNSQLAAQSHSSTIFATNQLSWFSENAKHRLKLATELRRDGVWLGAGGNTLGTFTFNSLADLASGRPSAFTRQIGATNTTADSWTGAVSLGDSYRPIRNVQVQLGVRLDGTRFDGSPAYNFTLDSIFQTQNDRVPNRVYASPRLGFSWVYGKSAAITASDGETSLSRAVVRGGVGVFQQTPTAMLLTSALSTTGLPDALQQVTCSASAAPTPVWASYGRSTAAIPTECTTGSTSFAANAPDVVFFARDFAAPRSVRGNLQWSGAILGNRAMLTANITYSLNLHQASTVDLNFSGVPRFQLASEAGRPMFAALEDIAPLTGASAVRDAQVSSLFNRVNERRSDLRSASREVSLSLSPTARSRSWSWRFNYLWAVYRDQQRGFGSSTAGSPLAVDWARSAMDARHQVIYAVNYNWMDLVRIGWTGSLRTGTPFTPVVNGDINGDGYAFNDRAFIVDPAHAADATVAAGMSQLLQNATAAVRRCLTRQLGLIARRNSCDGPWTHATTLTLTLNPLKLGLPQRAVLAIQVSNPLGAADLALHGKTQLRGWGQTPFPDPVLYAVRSFDRNSRAFRYDVNTRFGSPNPAFSTIRQPVVVTLRVQWNLGATQERQNLVNVLDRGRRSVGQRVAAPSLSRALSSGLTNPMSAILRQTDELKLTGEQADSLAVINSQYVDQVQTIWSRLSTAFADLPDDYGRGEMYRQYRRARESVVDLLIQVAPRVTVLLTPEQRRLLPAFVADYLNVRYLRSIRSEAISDRSSAYYYFF